MESTGYVLGMIDPTGLLMIEPEHVAVAPLIDDRTMRMAAALNNAVPSKTSWRGFHVCVCGAKSGNKDLFVDGVKTNSLAVHYLAWHRQDVPASELRKVDKLGYGLATPTDTQLASPANRELVVVEAPNVRLSKKRVKLQAPAPHVRYPGEGRSKVVPPGNGTHIDKMVDDLVRMFYYTFRGYEGPHPWGQQARPPQPEYRPLPVRDKEHGVAYRVLLQQYFKQPKVRARWFRTLSELREILRKVDPKNPKLRPTVIIDV